MRCAKAGRDSSQGKCNRKSYVTLPTKHRVSLDEEYSSSEVKAGSRLPSAEHILIASRGSSGPMRISVFGMIVGVISISGAGLIPYFLRRLDSTGLNCPS